MEQIHLIFTTLVPEDNVPHDTWSEDRRKYQFVVGGKKNQTP